MTTPLIYLVVMVLVAAVVFLLASLVFGRGEQMPPLQPGASPTRLPASGVSAEDLANDIRAHGRDERIGVRAYDEGAEYTYRLVKALTGGR